MTNLLREQKAFTLQVTYLIQRIYSSGYSCTFGDTYRDPRSHGRQGYRMAYGRRTSAHKQRLAIDLNLFKDGEYLTDTESHRQFGAYWKSMNEHNVWGGDFGHGNEDGNHYSRKYNKIA